MDKTKHPDRLIVMTYTLMALCWAGKNLLSLQDMAICAVSGVILGVITVMAEKTKLPTYICRAAGAMFAALFIIAVYHNTSFISSDAMTVIGSMIPPVAAGAMLIEGLCTSGTAAGRKKILTSLLVSVFLAVAVFIAMKLTGVTNA